MIVVAAWFLIVNISLYRKLRRDRRRYGYDCRVPVYVAPGLPSPCLVGLFRPAVYLTEYAAEDASQAHQIITHELTHLRHLDMIWALLRCVCLAVWWFDPLVWAAASLIRPERSPGRREFPQMKARVSRIRISSRRCCFV